MHEEVASGFVQLEPATQRVMAAPHAARSNLGALASGFWEYSLGFTIKKVGFRVTLGSTCRSVGEPRMHFFVALGAGIKEDWFYLRFWVELLVASSFNVKFQQPLCQTQNLATGEQNIM